MAIENSPLAQSPEGRSMRRRVLLDTPKAAEVLGIAGQTLHQWRMASKGPKYFKFGRRVLYDLADLEEWIEACRIDPEAR